MRPVMGSSILLTVITRMKRTQSTSLSLSHKDSIETKLLILKRLQERIAKVYNGELGSYEKNLQSESDTL